MYNRYALFMIGLIFSAPSLVSHDMHQLNTLQAEEVIQKDVHKLALIKTAQDLLLEIQNKQKAPSYTDADEQIVLHDVHRLIKTLKDLGDYEITQEHEVKQNGHRAYALFSVFSGIFICVNGVFFMLNPANKEYLINTAAASVLATLSAIFSMTYNKHAKAMTADMETLKNHMIHEDDYNLKDANIALHVPQTFFKNLIESIETCEQTHNVNLSSLKKRINDDLHAIERHIKS